MLEILVLTVLYVPRSSDIEGGACIEGESKGYRDRALALPTQDTAAEAAEPCQGNPCDFGDARYHGTFDVLRARHRAESKDLRY